MSLPFFGIFVNDVSSELSSMQKLFVIITLTFIENVKNFSEKFAGFFQRKVNRSKQRSKC